MKNWFTLPILAIALIFPAITFAQNTAQLQLARQVVTLQQGPEQKALWNDMANGAAGVALEKWGEEAFNQLKDAPEAKVTDASKKLDTELNKLHTNVLQLLEKTSPRVENEELVQFYAQNFSEAELKALIAWFESPAFKKYQEKAPEIAQTYMKALMERTHVQVQEMQSNFDSKAQAIIDAAKK